MSTRVQSIIGWTCAILVAAFTVFSAIMEFVPMTDPAVIAMVQKLGVMEIAHQLGIAKLIITAIFLYPRSSTVGFILMVGYYGGALATNITHGFTAMEAGGIYAALLLLTISAWFRNPEVTTRLLKGKA